MNAHTYIVKFKKLSLSYKLHYLLLFFCIITTLYICFYRLGTAPLDDWDEAWYGEMTKQILRTGEIFVMQWNGDKLLDKPPLYIWSSAIISKMIGLSEFSVRLTSAITGFATIILAIWYALRKWGTLPAFLTFVTLTLNNIVIWRVRSGNLDALVTFLIFMTFLIIQWKNKLRYVILGLLFACIFLTKASLVVFPVIIFCLHELIFEWRNVFKNILYYVAMAALAIIPVYIWLKGGAMKVGPEFMDYYLHRSDQGVSDTKWEYFKKDYWMYAYYSLQRRFFFVLIVGWLFMIIDLRKRENVLMLFYSLFLLILLTFTQRLNNWYLMPSMPFWSLIIGYGTYRLMNLMPKFRTVAMILILLPTLYVSQKTYRENITPILYTYSSGPQTQTAKKMNELSKPGDTVVRLDHLYPTAIYYSDRKVFASPSDANTSDLFIKRSELADKLKAKNIKVIGGANGDVESFLKEYRLEGKIIQVNENEKVFLVL